MDTSFYTKNNQTLMKSRDWRKLLKMVANMEKELSLVGVRYSTAKSIHNPKEANKVIKFLFDKELVSYGYLGGYVPNFILTQTQRTLVLRTLFCCHSLR